MMWRIKQIRENVIHQGQRLRWRTFSQWSRIKLIQNVFLWGWTESGLWSKVTWSVHCASKELKAATQHLDRDASACFMHLMIHWWSRIMNSDPDHNIKVKGTWPSEKFKKCLKLQIWASYALSSTLTRFHLKMHNFRAFRLGLLIPSTLIHWAFS